MKPYSKIIFLQVCVQVAEYYRQARQHLDTSNERAMDMETISDCVGDKKFKFWTK